MAKVVLVDSPAWILNRPRDYNMLGLISLAAPLRNAGHDVRLMSAHEVTSWDAKNRSLVIHREKMPYCDFLGVSATTPQIQWTQEMAKAWPASVKVLGGPHATYVMSGPYEEYKQPEYFEGFNFLLTGECEETLPEFIKGVSKVSGAWSVDKRRIHPLSADTKPARAQVENLLPPAYDLLNGSVPEIRLRHDGKGKAKRFASVVTSKGCLIAGTLVTLSSGDSIPIENIINGDIIKGYDVERKVFVDAPVRSVWEREAEDQWEVSLEDSTVIGITGEHPV